MLTNNVTKFDDDPWIWLVIVLGRDILPTNIFTKFNDYTMKTI